MSTGCGSRHAGDPMEAALKYIGRLDQEAAASVSPLAGVKTASGSIGISKDDLLIHLIKYNCYFIPNCLLGVKGLLVQRYLHF